MLLTLWQNLMLARDTKQTTALCVCLDALVQVVRGTLKQIYSPVSRIISSLFARDRSVGG